METSSTAPTPDEAAAALRQARSAGSTLAGGLVLPSHFYSAIGTAVALQISVAAVGIGQQNAWGTTLAVASLLVALAAGVVQISRFRSLNGVRIRGFESRVVGGTANTTSAVYAIAFGGAVWAALAHAWWVVPVFGVLGGVGYAVFGQRWWDTYQRDPAGNSGGESAVWLAVLGVIALAGMAALAAGS